MADEKEEGELETVNTAEAIRKEIKELHKELAKINKEEEGNIIGWHIYTLLLLH